MKLGSLFVAVVLVTTAALAATATAAGAGIAPSTPTILRPDGQGDQVIFYYDAREGFTTFLTVRNAGSSELDVQVTFQSGGFSTPYVEDLVLGPNQLRVIDVGGLVSDGLSPSAGVAFANAVDDANAPIVTRALTGNFTVANLMTASGWGSPGAARSAVYAASDLAVGGADADGATQPQGLVTLEPPLGTVIDGTTVALTPIQPLRLDLSAYYNPDDLAPAADGGNQLIFVSFADTTGVPYAAVPQSTLWQVVAYRSDGSLVANTTFGASGVQVTDLASVLGDGVSGSSGSVHFTAESTSAPVTRLIFFTESLGTFGTGYLLPTEGFGPGSMMF